MSIDLSVSEAIKTRRSIRKYVQESISKEDLRDILSLASLAPTANNLQPTRFVVVQNKELQEKIQEVSYNQAQVTSAPAVVVVYADMEDALANLESIVHPNVPQERRQATIDGLLARFGGQSVEERNAWALTQANIVFGFLMLAARSKGYDTSPMLGFQPGKLRELLKLPEHVQFAGIMPIGKAAEEGFSHHRHDLDKIATFY